MATITACAQVCDVLGVCVNARREQLDNCRLLVLVP